MLGIKKHRGSKKLRGLPLTWDKSYDGHDYDPRLLSKCPHCHKPLRFNPFIVDNRDRY
jgi:hypothetical protein